MNRNEMLIKIQEIFRDIFDDTDLIINESTCSEDIDDWDSLEQINLIVSIEKSFDIKFDILEIGNLNNVGEMINLIRTKIND